MATKSKEITLAVGFVIFGAITLLWLIPEFSAPHNEPTSLLSTLMALSIIILGLADTARAFFSRNPGTEEDYLDADEPSGSIQLVIISTVVIFGFAWAAEHVGFVLGAGISTAILLYAFDVRTKTALFTIPVVFSFSLYFLFNVLLSTPLPTGWLS